LAVQIISLLVGLYGIYIIGDSLHTQITSHRASHLTDLIVDFPLLIGLSIIYLSGLLRRRKRTAWVVTILAYTFYLGDRVSLIIGHSYLNGIGWISVLRDLVLPTVIIGILYYFRKEFVVKSDIQGFRFALRFVVIIFMIAIIYGVSGFELLDTKDFHQEISFTSALHYTIDQFNLTTSKPIVPYTKRAHLFVDSLSFVSLVAVAYAVLSLFQPLRERFTDQTFNRERAKMLLSEYNADAEEFFKLWPQDKQYYFDDSSRSVLAFHVLHGVALILSDPVGDEERFKALIAGFSNLCFNNDWLPALVHVSDKYMELYKKAGFTMQLLGQEAIVDINHFQENVKDNKYFRNISNKFKKQDYSFEILKPPHHQALVDRLKVVSEEWLSKGGRSERGFAMGYFTKDYIEQCEVAVARDAAGTIQAFANIVPAEFDKKEVTYDLLRQSNSAIGNINDFLLINILGEMFSRGYKTLNMGLSALSGIDEIDKDKQTIIDNFLKFAYNNGDRFYSFSGLYRFKSKYEPTWQDKYVGYRNGITGFSRTMTALTRCMSKVVKLDKPN
jgi:phosphatidylglycerol lysyltransferase